jgi:hypothetical protein
LRSPPWARLINDRSSLRKRRPKALRNSSIGFRRAADLRGVTAWSQIAKKMPTFCQNSLIVERAESYIDCTSEIAVETRGTTLRYLRKYSPDLNPIEMSFPKGASCAASGSPNARPQPPDAEQSFRLMPVARSEGRSETDRKNRRYVFTALPNVATAETLEA